MEKTVRWALQGLTLLYAKEPAYSDEKGGSKKKTRANARLEVRRGGFEMMSSSIGPSGAVDNLWSEWTAILMMDDPYLALLAASRCGLVKSTLPEFEPTIGMAQNQKHHPDDVYTHSAKTCAIIRKDVVLRWAGFLHDLGKGYTRRFNKTDGRPTFHKHEVMSLKKGRELLERLGAPEKEKNRILFLVRNHMYHYTSDTWALFSSPGVEVPKTRCGSPDDCWELNRLGKGGGNSKVELVLRGWKDTTVLHFAKTINVQSDGDGGLVTNALFELRAADRVSRNLPTKTKKQEQFESRILDLLGDKK